MKKIQDYNIILLVSLYINKGYFIMRKIKNELCNNRRLLSVVLAIIDVAFIALLLIGLCIGIFGKHTIFRLNMEKSIQIKTMPKCIMRPVLRK